MFETMCPKCGAEDALFVVSGEFTARMMLTKEGFSFLESPYVHTENETVECAQCGAEMTLSDLVAE